MTAPIDIRPVDLAIVQDILRAVLPATAKVYVFGSRALWTTKDGSDLDLAIDAGRKLTREESLDLADAFEESDLPYKVDVVDLHDVSDSFKAIVDRDKVALGLGRRGWKKQTLGDLVQLQRGIDLPDHQRQKGSVPILGSFGITGRHNKAACKPPGVTVGRSGASAGTVCFIDEPYWPLNTCLYVKDFKGNDPKFAYYFLKTFDLASLNSGSAQPSLNRNFVHPVEAYFPQPPEQAAIASILAALDDKIELNRAMNETLEAMARAIFKDWFVDFGPTRAKIHGQAPYLPPEIWSLFPDTLDDEGTPEGWEASTVGAEFDLTMGQSPPGDTYNESGDGLPFFQGRTDFGFRYPVRRKYCSAPVRLAKADDTLISVRAPVGDLNMAWETSCIGRGVAAARHVSGLRGFTQYSLKEIQPEIQRFEDSGSVFGAINKVQFERLSFLAPSLDLIEAYEFMIAPLDDQIRLNTEEITTLVTTRDFLLPKLMSGEVRVENSKTLQTAS